eukprot:876637-Amorphochlora_amoeboformis.AAC.1
MVRTSSSGILTVNDDPEARVKDRDRVDSLRRHTGVGFNRKGRNHPMTNQDITLGSVSSEHAAFPEGPRRSPHAVLIAGSLKAYG